MARRAIWFGARLCGPSPFGSRPISDVVKSNGERLLLVDTLALVRRMEEKGVPTKQAEAVKDSLTELLNDSRENMCRSLVPIYQMDKSVMTKNSDLSKFITEVSSSEEQQYSLLQHDLEKLRREIEKMHSELRYEMEKVTASQRLDLNLEKGRIRDELNNQKQETTNLTNKINREIHELRAQMEAAKYDVIKYFIGALASISAVGLAALRILL